MKTRIFFLISSLIFLAGCSNDDNLPEPLLSKPETIILEVVSLKFVHEDTDIVEPVKGDVETLFETHNGTGIFQPQSFKWKDKTNDTSHFEIKEGDLPHADNDVKTLEIKVPRIDCLGNVLDQGGEVFPLQFGQEVVKRITMGTEQKLDFEVAPNSTIVITNQNMGYRFTMSFYLTFRDIHTEQCYYLKGKWTGVQMRESYVELSGGSSKKGSLRKW